MHLKKIQACLLLRENLRSKEIANSRVIDNAIAIHIAQNLIDVSSLLYLQRDPFKDVKGNEGLEAAARQTTLAVVLKLKQPKVSLQMNCLEKYRSKLITEINRDLGVILESPEEDPVHNFRVGVKRLTALFYFLHEIDPELKAKQLLKPYRVPFKAIGNIRDVHIAVQLIDSLEDIGPQDSKALTRGLKSKARQDYRMFQKSIPTGRRLSLRMPTIKSTRISVRSINRQKPVTLTQLLAQILAPGNRLDARQWHKKRILLKRYHHVLDAFCFCPGHALDETELKQIKMLEQLLGDWHDRVVTAELMRSLPGLQNNLGPAMAIMERQDKLLLGAAKIYLKKFALWHQHP